MSRARHQARPLKRRTHAWELQIPGDPTRSGCTTCGAETDDTGPETLYRRPEDREFSRFRADVDELCVPARGRKLEPNPANASRALRVQGLHGGPAEKLPAGTRCASCGYGATASEGWRMERDFDALEEDMRRSCEAPSTTDTHTEGSP